MTHMVYLDHNATTPLLVDAKSAAIKAMDVDGNPSAVHGNGRKARRIVEDAREQVRLAVKAPKSAQVVFTSGGTEANTLAVNGVSRDRILISAVEHASVVGAGRGCESLAVDGFGRVDLGHLQSLLSVGSGSVLVSVMLANNETGVLQNIEDITHLAHRFGALVHTDAVQAMAKIDVDFVGLGVDLLSLSAHKIGGPLGVGALIASRDVTLVAVNHGGGQENGVRGGTENISGIAGFGVAMERANVGGMDPVRILRDDLEKRILKLAPESIIFGASVNRLPNTSFISMPGVKAETQVMAFDLAGICVSAGSACASGKTKGSTVLAAMGIDESVAKTALRISLGVTNTQNDIDCFFSVWKDLYERQAQKLSAA